MKRNKNINRKIIRRLTRAHVKITSVFFVFYLLVSLVVDPLFLVQDFRQKYNALAATASMGISLRVPAAPEKPVVSHQPGCFSGVPLVELSWNNTSDTENYDIYRGSSVLATGLSENYYRDNAIQNNSSYVYRVIANGPAGNTASEEVMAISSSCGNANPPTLDDLGLNRERLGNTDEIPEIEDPRPVISGNTNIPFSIVNITVFSGPVFSATIQANSNGYWSWKVPGKLNQGDHTVIIKAVDPNDPSIFVSGSFYFNLVSKDEPASSKKQSAPNNKKSKDTQQKPEIPFSLFVLINNPDKKVRAGENLKLTIQVNFASDDKRKYEEKIHYEILDQDGNRVWNSEENADLFEIKSISKEIPLSKLMPGGEYKFVVKSVYQEKTITAENNFIVEEAPVLNTGSAGISYNQLMNMAGWVLLSLLAILAVFLMMLGIEHHLSRSALFHISENYLSEKGFVSGRRGVSR